MTDSHGIIYPDYSNSIVNIPSSILDHFGLNYNKSTLKSPLFNKIRNCSKVILFLVDGLGYDLWKQKVCKSSFFNKIEENGFTKKITTTFPSSTPAALTSLHSGLTPLEHGLLEWNLYFQELGLLLETLPYKTITTEFQTQEFPQEKPEILFNGTTIFEQLKKGGVDSFYFVPKEYANSVYTTTISRGATIISYDSPDYLSGILSQTLQSSGKNIYYFIYWPRLDEVEHRDGPNGKELDSEINLLSNILTDLISKLKPKELLDTALLLTADHGQIKTEPEKTIYLNQFTEVTNHFKKNPSGKPILPTGGARDVFLSIRDDKLQEVVQFLKNTFKDTAKIITINHNSITPLFGKGKQHVDFFSRLGNILIIPKENYTIWYKYKVNENFHNLGHHGGLTPEEMFVPLAGARLDQLT